LSSPPAPCHPRVTRQAQPDAATPPDRDPDEQYREHVVASLTADPWARVIKLSDFTDNAVGIVWTSAAKARRVAPKYFPLVDDLRELAARPDTPLDDDVKRHIDNQLTAAEQRLAAFIPDADPTPA